MDWILLQRRPFGSWQSRPPKSLGRPQQKGARWSSPACQRLHSLLVNPMRQLSPWLFLLVQLFWFESSIFIICALISRMSLICTVAFVDADSVLTLFCLIYGLLYTHWALTKTYFEARLNEAWSKFSLWPHWTTLWLNETLLTWF